MRRRSALREFFIDSSWFLWLFALAAAPVSIAYRGAFQAAALLAAVFPFALFYAARRICKKLFAFVTAHIAIAAISFAAAGYSPAGRWVLFIGADIVVNVFMVFYVVLILFAFGYSFRSRLAESKPEYGSGTAAFFFVSLAVAGLVCEFSGVQAAARLIALTFAVLLALMFLTGQMLGLDGTLQWGGADLTRGRASIVRFNNRIVAAFILFFLAAAAVAYAFGFASGLAEIVARAWGLFLKFMRWAGSRRGGSQPEADYSQALSDADIGGAYDAPDIAAHSEPWLIWVILERAFLALFVLATAAAAVAAVAYGCYRLYKLFYKKTVEAGSDEKEFLDAGFTLSFRRKGEARRLAPTNKVRRAFYKKVKKHMTKKKDAVSVGPSDTSWEIAKKIKASEDIDALTANYQEARYGG